MTNVSHIKTNSKKKKKKKITKHLLKLLKADNSHSIKACIAVQSLGISRGVNFAAR